MRDKNLNLNKRDKMYTLEQCLEQQKKVDASIKHNGEYNPVRAARAETVEMQEWLGLIKTWGENKIDMKQAFMELVDTQAFTISALLIESSGDCTQISESFEWNRTLTALNTFDEIGVDTDKLADCYSGRIKLHSALLFIAGICEHHFKRQSQIFITTTWGSKH